MRPACTLILVLWAVSAHGQTAAWFPAAVSVFQRLVQPGDAISLVVPNANGRTLGIDLAGPEGETRRVQSEFDAVGHTSIEIPGDTAPGAWNVAAIQAAGSPVWRASSAGPRFTVAADAPHCSPAVTFNLDALADADKQAVRAGITFGSRYLCGRGIDPLPAATIVVDTTAERPTAEARGATIIIYANSSTWRTTTAASKVKILVHEYFHVIQHRTTVRPATWLLEGAAEYVAYRAVDAAGIIAYPTARGQQFSGLRQLTGTLDNPGDSATQPVYAMYHLAVELLCEAVVSLASNDPVNYVVRGADGRIGRQVYASGDVLRREGTTGPPQSDVFIRQWRNGGMPVTVGPVARTNAAGAWRFDTTLTDGVERGRWHEQPVYGSASADSAAALARYEVDAHAAEVSTGVDLIFSFQKTLEVPGSWETTFLQVFLQTPSEFVSQFEQFRALAQAPLRQGPLTISLWGRFAPGALGDGTPAASIPYVFRITGVTLSSLSTDQLRQAFIRPANTGWGGTRLGSDLLVIYFSPDYPPGTYTAGLQLPDGRRASTSFEFSTASGTNSVPTVTGMLPNLYAGDPGTPATVRGTGFTVGSTVYWNGMVRAARLLSGTEITITLSGADLAPGTHHLNVTNPAPGGGTSAPFAIDISN